MAELNIQFPVDLCKNNNESSTKYGRIYARTPRRNTLNTRGLAKHVAEHGSICTFETMMLVLNQLAICIPELLSQGHSVELDGLGTFTPTIASADGAKDVPAALAKGPDGMVKGVRMRFIPNNTDLLALTSKKLKAKCSLKFQDYVDVQKKTVDGKEASYTTRVPLDQWDNYVAEADGQNP